MNRGEFLMLMEATYAEIVEMNKVKGADYAGDEDVVSNFRRNADALGLKPEQVWAVYAGKHWDSIQTFCREGDVASEPIEGRIKDLILYGFLLLAMVRDNDVHTVDAARIGGRIEPPQRGGRVEALQRGGRAACAEEHCSLSAGHSGPHIERVSP